MTCWLNRNSGLQLLFGEPRYLAAARSLVDGQSVYIDGTGERSHIDYYHILLDSHEVLFANNLPADSLFLGNQTLLSIGDQGREEIATLFPEALDLDVIHSKTALPVLRPFEAAAWKTWLLDPASAGVTAQH